MVAKALADVMRGTDTRLEVVKTPRARAAPKWILRALMKRVRQLVSQQTWVSPSWRSED